MDKPGKPPRGKRTHARAVYFVEPGAVEVRDVELQPKPGEVLVESELIGISHGTEMLIFNGDIPRGLPADSSLDALSGDLEYPLKYGYINVGRREDGERVFAFYPHQNRFYARSEELTVLPEDLEAADAVFLANMETALNIVHDAHPLFGETVLIVGQGVVGLLTAAVLTHTRAVDVLAIEPCEKRREASAALGCLTFDPEQPDLASLIRDRTDGRGVDIAVNVCSSGSGLQLAIDSLAFSGTVLEASWYGSREVTLGLGTSFHRKRLTIRSSQVSTISPGLRGRWDKRRRIDVVMDLLRRIRPSRYITHRMSLEQAQEAFDLLREKPEETLQIVLEP